MIFSIIYQGKILAYFPHFLNYESTSYQDLPILYYLHVILLLLNKWLALKN